MIDLSTLKKIVSRALGTKQDEIHSHIEGVQLENRTTDIEKVFARAFEAEILEINIKHHQALNVIGTASYYPDRNNGFLDCYFPDEKTAIEYKAARLPRRHQNNVTGALYDVGQITSDYLRLNRAKNLKHGYVIAFVYGPLVLDASSPGNLYRTFHNQMFVDFSVATENKQEHLTRTRRQACGELMWDSAWGTSTAPKSVAAVKSGSLGAIIIDCRA